MSKSYLFQCSQVIGRSRDEVFRFFADAGNLERITPEFLKFKILTPLPIELKPGTIIDYSLRLSGVPFYWQTRIEAWDPPARFSDIQAKGPYRRWHHLHEFYDVADGTLCVDTVTYELPLGAFGRLANLLLVQRSLERIFAYRREALTRLLS